MGCHAHLDLAKQKIEQLCRQRAICLISVTGRVKTLKQCRTKLQQMIKGTLGAVGGPCAALDRIGVRVVVKDARDLKLLVTELKRGMILCKDYVTNPRRDGEILNKDERDVYRGYHVFTRRITGVPIELQMFTRQMRQSGIALKRKYGNGYWKTRAFRHRRVKLGDIR